MADVLNFEKQLFKVPFWALNRIKCWPGAEKVRFQRFLDFWIVFTICTVTVACLACSLQELLKGDVVMCCDALAPTLSMIPQLIKYLIFKQKEDEFRKIFDELKAINSIRSKMQKRNEDKAAFLSKANFLVLAMASSTSLFFTSVPWIIAVYRKIHNLPFLYILQFKTKWPIEVNSGPRYAFMFVFIQFMIFVIPCTLGGIDNFILNFSAYTGTMLESIGFEIQDIGSQVFSQPFSNKGVGRKLTGVVQRHVAAIKFCRKWERLIGSLVFVEISSAAFTICLSGFMFLTAKEVALKMNYVFFFIAVVLQAFYYCYGGNEVTESGMKIAETVYQMPWEQLNMENKKTLVLIMARSQVPVGIRVPFFDCAFPLFVNIMQAAGSYLALLDTLMDK